jgi:hypothetical protein
MRDRCRFEDQNGGRRVCVEVVDADREQR